MGVVAVVAVGVVEIETKRDSNALKVPIQAVVQRERHELPGDLKTAIPEAFKN